MTIYDLNNVYDYNDEDYPDQRLYIYIVDLYEDQKEE